MVVPGFSVSRSIIDQIVIDGMQISNVQVVDMFDSDHYIAAATVRLYISAWETVRR